jgi:hypothetical protein
MAILLLEQTTQKYEFVVLRIELRGHAAKVKIRQLMYVDRQHFGTQNLPAAHSADQNSMSFGTAGAQIPLVVPAISRCCGAKNETILAQKIASR